MNVQNPISRIMSSYNLKVLMPEDSMTIAKNLFETQNVHHLPVVASGKLLGILSKSDFLYYTKQVEKGSGDELIQKTLLNSYKVKNIMTKDIITIQKNETIMEALKFLKETNSIVCQS